jgi:hypothetical protein
MKNKEVEDKMLGELNDFMKRFGVEEITFGKRHKVEKTTSKKAKSKLLKK